MLTLWNAQQFFYPKTGAILNKNDYKFQSKCYKNVPGNTSLKQKPDIQREK
jgi:hypothetical protein